MAQGISRGLDDQKTRMFETPPAASPDDAKTQVFQRPAPVRSAPPVPLTVVAAPPPPPIPAHTGLRFRYCPSCTAANPTDATVCSGCGLPLAGVPAPGGAPKQSQWALYAAIAVAAILAVALVVVLVVKR
jgi:hypothetical protein